MKYWPSWKTYDRVRRSLDRGSPRLALTQLRLLRVQRPISRQVLFRGGLPVLPSTMPATNLLHQFQTRYAQFKAL